MFAQGPSLNYDRKSATYHISKPYLYVIDGHSVYVERINLDELVTFDYSNDLEEFGTDILSNFNVLMVIIYPSASAQGSNYLSCYF